MANGLDRLGELLLDASLSATALLSLVALAMIGCRQPVRRICLARAAILSVLALIPLVIFAPFPRVPLPGVAQKSGLYAHPIFSDPDHHLLPSNLTAKPPAWKAVSRPFRGLIGAPPRWLIILYLTGTAMALSGLLLGYWGLTWLTSRSREVSPLADELYRSLPVHAWRPRLRVSERVRRPVLVGLFRQTILIPADLDLPESSDKLRLSLLHELAHAERLDPWFGLASSLAQSFWFFVPPLWWIRSQMRLDQEFMADRRAAGAFGPLQNYASSLVKIASGESVSRPTPAALPATRQVSTSALFQRVLMLVQCPFPVEARPPRWWIYSLPSLVLLGTLAASCLTLRVSDHYVPLPSPVTQSFRMTRLVVNPPNHPTGSPHIYELPVRLPESFDLTLEIWGDRDELSQTKVVGLRLLDANPNGEPHDLDTTWHRVRIHREADGIHAQLDEHPIPIDPDLKLTAALRFETPANHPAHLRNLHLTWTATTTNLPKRQ